MKATITIEVPDEFLEARATALNNEMPGLPLDARGYFEQVIRDMLVKDAIRAALFAWPVEVEMGEIE